MFHVKHDLWGDPPGPDCPRSGDPHDLAIAWETAPEADWFSAGRLRVSTRHRLHMHVRLGAVPRVATFTDQVADTHRLPLDHTDTVAPEMAHGHHDTLGSFDEHDIAGQCPPASVSYTHLRAHETVLELVCRLLLEKKNTHKEHT